MRTSRKLTGSGGRWARKSEAAAVSKNCTTESGAVFCGSETRTREGLTARDSVRVTGAVLQAATNIETKTDVVSA